MAKWIKYKIVCNADKNILLDKKLEYTDSNIVIAQNEAYEGIFTIEEDERNLEKEPLGIKFGGTGAKTGAEACKNIGALQAPSDTSSTEGFLYQNPDGTVKLEPRRLFKYSVIVDNGTDGTPSAVEYADDCVGFTPMTMNDGVLNEGSWAGNKLLEMFRPCVIAPEDASPKYYLDKTNMSLKEDGTAAVLTGEDGDVMVEVSGLIYGKFEHISNNRVKISILNYSESGCFCFNDFGTETKLKFYRGRYKLGYKSPNYGSFSGVSPSKKDYRSVFREHIISRGKGYHQNNVYMLFLWQAMFLLLFKTRDSQSALGNGRTNASAVSNCGWSNSYGWIWGTTANSTDGVVFLGVEDFYGNVLEYVDGFTSLAGDYTLTRNPAIYNDEGTDYEIFVKTSLTNTDGGKYQKIIYGTNDICFLPVDTGGSSTTFFCDSLDVSVNINTIVAFGGYFEDDKRAGAFFWQMNKSFDASDKNNYKYIGSRICRI